LTDDQENTWRLCSWACVASFARQVIRDAHEAQKRETI
jgi:hypothetical protein